MTEKPDWNINDNDKPETTEPLFPADRECLYRVVSPVIQDDPTKRAYQASMPAPGVHDSNCEIANALSGRFKTIVSMEGHDCHIRPHLEIVSCCHRLLRCQRALQPHISTPNESSILRPRVSPSHLQALSAPFLSSSAIFCFIVHDLTASHKSHVRGGSSRLGGPPGTSQTPTYALPASTA